MKQSEKTIHDALGYRDQPDQPGRYNHPFRNRVYMPRYRSRRARRRDRLQLLAMLVASALLSIIGIALAFIAWPIS